MALASWLTRLASRPIAPVFFGFHCLLLGYLLSRSTFLPRIFGGLMALAGLCSSANSIKVVESSSAEARG